MLKEDLRPTIPSLPEVCPACKGKGFDEQHIICEVCEGYGKVYTKQH